MGITHIISCKSQEFQVLVCAHSMFMLGIPRKEGEIDLQMDTDASHHTDSILLPQKYMIVIYTWWTSGLGETASLYEGAFLTASMNGVPSGISPCLAL